MPIVPISIHYSGDKIYSTVGEPITIGINEDAITAITQLRDIMATMKYEQMEACGMYKRTDVDKEDFETLIKASLGEYPTFNREYEEKCVFKH